MKKLKFTNYQIDRLNDVAMNLELNIKDLLFNEKIPAFLIHAMLEHSKYNLMRTAEIEQKKTDL